MNDFEDKILAEALKLFTTGGATIYSQDGKVFLHKSFRDFLLQVVREAKDNRGKEILAALPKMGEWKPYEGNEYEIERDTIEKIRKIISAKE